MVLLNAGCGDDFKGSVRIDKIQTKAVTIVADLQHLPLRTKCIDNTICISVIEHTDNPIVAVQELCRVTKHKIIIEVPIKTRQGLGNILRLFVPNKQNIEILRHLPNYARDDKWQFNQDSVAILLKHNGFDETYTHRIFIFWTSSISRCYRTIGICNGCNDI